jgi:hypothetical protein
MNFPSPTGNPSAVYTKPQSKSLHTVARMLAVLDVPTTPGVASDGREHLATGDPLGGGGHWKWTNEDGTWWAGTYFNPNDDPVICVELSDHPATSEDWAGIANAIRFHINRDAD